MRGTLCRPVGRESRPASLPASIPKVPGGDLLSHSVSRAVPSAVEGLTSGFGMEPGVSPLLWPPEHIEFSSPRPDGGPRGLEYSIASASRRSSPRTISTGRLNALLRLHLPPIDPVVCWGPYRVLPVGALILEWASHLDAFSAYPCRTWLISSAAGATTDTPEVRPPRSSRTGGSSPQISCARDG